MKIYKIAKDEEYSRRTKWLNAVLKQVKKDIFDLKGVYVSRVSRKDMEIILSLDLGNLNFFTAQVIELTDEYLQNDIYSAVNKVLNKADEMATAPKQSEQNEIDKQAGWDFEGTPDEELERIDDAHGLNEREFDEKKRKKLKQIRDRQEKKRQPKPPQD